MEWLGRINEWIWQWLLPPCLLLSALLCGAATKMAPLRGFGRMLRETYGSLLRPAEKKRKQSPSQRQIFATALAATMGTGNLVGTAVAISMSGAGALFWMWVSAVVGMLLVYVENTLGIRYRDRKTAGTLAYLKNGVRSPLLTGLFAFCCVGASLGMGNLAQSNALASALYGIGVPLPVSGAVTAGLLLLILGGGSKRIGRVTEWLMPLLCGGYLLGCMWLLFCRAEVLPAVLLRIVREAFGIQAVSGGFCASAMLYTMGIGIRRGIFSNEAGLGSSAMLHMEAQNTTPHRQGQWAAAEVFADTVICCTATALVLLTAPDGVIAYGSQDGALLLLAAFADGFGSFAVWFLAICIALLAFATLIGWYGCGRAAFCYLAGETNSSVYLALYLVAAFGGALGKAEWVWLLCDLCNGCMAFPNLVGLCRLLPVIKQEKGTCENRKNVI